MGKLQVTIPKTNGFDVERAQIELGVDGIDLANLDENPEYFGRQDTRAGARGITRPNHHVVIYKANAGVHGFPTGKQGLEERIQWHHAELNILAKHVIIPPLYSAIVEGGGQAPRLYTVARALTSPDLYDRLTLPAESAREHTSAWRQKPVVALGEKMLSYLTDTDRPQGQPVIRGITHPDNYALVRGQLALREGSVPVPASFNPPETGIDGELWALGNWVHNELRETPQTLALEDAIAQARQ